MTTYQICVKLYGQSTVDKWLNNLMEEIPPPTIQLEHFKAFIESFWITRRTTHGYEAVRVPDRKMTFKDILSSQKIDVVTVRFVLVKYFVDNYPHYDFDMIGIIFGGKDQSTMRHAYREACNRLDIGDPETVEAWQKLKDYVGTRKQV